MRLWTFHPRYLDARGLVAAWREALLARKVLAGETRGYRRHPQLVRFKQALSPADAIDAYLRALYEEACARGYRFSTAQLGAGSAARRIPVANGQLAYEWYHYRRKVRRRDPPAHARVQRTAVPCPHPLFRIVPGPVASWERVVD
ncbi:MAG: DNA lyase [Chitinivibrionales bacterium]|nr:DNA lyase [Chitinivibrionales bacterium]MBD3394636.1 DNA lyase [Chitinivibrionales bacterium]